MHNGALSFILVHRNAPSICSWFAPLFNFRTTVTTSDPKKINSGHKAGDSSSDNILQLLKTQTHIVCFARCPSLTIEEKQVWLYNYKVFEGLRKKCHKGDISLMWCQNEMLVTCFSWKKRDWWQLDSLHTCFTPLFSAACFCLFTLNGNEPLMLRPLVLRSPRTAFNVTMAEAEPWINLNKSANAIKCFFFLLFSMCSRVGYVFLAGMVN